MILRSQLTQIGRINKPHGVSGEMTATIEPGIDPAALRCIVLDRDGIYTPFFITNVRPRSSEAWLITIDGFNDEREAASLAGQQIYAIAAELPDATDDGADEEDDEEAEGYFASDFVGCDIILDDGTTLGRITDLDDRTANYLFIVERPDGSEVMVPVADEFITDIDIDRRRIGMSLPEGLIE